MNKSFFLITGALVLLLGFVMLWFAVKNFSTQANTQSTGLDTSQFPVSETEDSFIAPSNALLQQLTSATWVWERTELENDLVIEPYQKGDFTLSFAPGGAVRGTTDCNAINSVYTVENNLLTIQPFAMTRKYCEDSQELVFTNFFAEASTVLMTSDGNMTLILPFDKGSIFFVRETPTIE